MSLWESFEAEAHREWHRNTGEKYGCPQDACEPPEPDHCRVPECFRYLDDDGTCVDAGDEAHVQHAADLMDLRLTLSLEPKAPPEPDPWF